MKRTYFPIIAVLLTVALSIAAYYGYESFPSKEQILSPLQILLLPFLGCLLLTGIHSYLGIHVIRRDVIFVDIALAQMAALGIMLAAWFGFSDEHLDQIGFWAEKAPYLFGLVGTLIGAFLFAFLRDTTTSQEAIVGICFAVSSALSILIADRIPHGAEALKSTLSGNILFVSSSTLWNTFLLYAALSLFHLFLRKKFWLMSSDVQAAQKAGMNRTLWDFLFYASFGVIITSSVQMGGVLLVFSFLIIPVSISSLFFKRFLHRFWWGWLIGTLASISGIILSFKWDLPTVPAIVTTLGIFWICAFIVKKILSSITHSS